MTPKEIPKKFLLNIVPKEGNNKRNYRNKKLNNNNKNIQINFPNYKYQTASNSKGYLYTIFLLFMIISIISNTNNYRTLISNQETIALKLYGKGEQLIFNPEVGICPVSVYLNDQIENIINPNNCSIVNISQEENVINNITIIWNSKFIGTGGMFFGLMNLLEIDLSNFDFSLVQNTISMFHDCQRLTSINFGNINTSSLQKMEGMFFNCFSLKQLDLSLFDTSKVTNMSCLFHGCQQITYINLGNFKTSEVLCMSYMFYSCVYLSNLTLGSFDTSKVTDMKFMFCNCQSIMSLDVSSFNTSSVNDMNTMFAVDKKLLSLDLQNFDTSKVTLMNNLFDSCYALTFVNLKSFNTSQVITMNFMFYNCWKLNHLDLSNFQTPNLQTMQQIFHGCQQLSYLNISSFDTSNVVNMAYAFSQCSSLYSIDLKNFITENVFWMEGMFYNCINLTYLDLSSFNTNSVNNLNFMFYNCRSLTCLKLTNFYTPHLSAMGLTFYNCISLELLDISNLNTYYTYNMEFTFANCVKLKNLYLPKFNPQRLIYMNGTFGGCNSLTTIDLSYLDTSSIKYMDLLFYGCNSLEYIKFEKYNETENLESFNNALNYVPGNIVICVNENNTIEKLKNQIIINNINCAVFYCGEDWKNYQKILAEDNTCLEQTETIFIINNKETTTNILQEIPTTYIPSTTPEIYKSTFISINNTISNKIILDTINIATTHNDIIDSTIIKEKEYTHITNIKSTEVIDNFLINNSTNVITYYELNEYSSVVNNLFKETQFIINKNSDTFIKDESALSSTEKNIDAASLFTIIKSENSDASNFTSEEINRRKYEEIVNKIIQDFDGSNEEELVKKGEDNFYFQLTTLENELNPKGKNSNNTRFSRIDLGECANVLRKKNNLNENATFLILKYEKISNISSERYLQYEIYESINKTRLDLSVCQDIPIDIYVPLVLSEKLENLYNELKSLGYDLFDINSEFYQDICTPYKSSNGTDVLLSDRIDYYFGNDETQCQPNCQFSDYSMETQDLKCECNIVESEINVEKKQEIGSKSIYKSFYDVLKFSNYKVLKCYKLAFNKNIFINNKGNYMVLTFFGIYSIFLVLYIIKGRTQLKDDLSKIIFDNNSKEINLASININPRIHLCKENIIEMKHKSQHKIIYNNINEKNNIEIIKKNKNNKKLILRKDFKKKKPKSRIIFDFPPKKNLQNFYFKEKKVNNIKENEISSKIKINKNDRIENETKNLQKISSKKLITTNIEELDNFELNNLDYSDALKFDKRKFFSIYWSILQREHSIIFTFFIRNDHNLTYVKYERFIFFICTDMALNVFFFSDETMHKMFLDYGKYNFVQQIPQIIYSTIVSQLIQIFVCFLSLTDKHFYQIKNLKIKTRIQILRIERCIQMKIYFFFMFTGFMFFFYWYIITCFCAVYENTQIAFIKDSFLSFGLGLLYPFVLYLFPSGLRIVSLNFLKGKLSFIYKLSDLIPFF